MGPSSQFSTKLLQRTQHFYGFFYVHIVFTAVRETKTPTTKIKRAEKQFVVKDTQNRCLVSHNSLGGIVA